MREVRLILILILLLGIVNFASAECNSGQIDVNTASAEELDKLTGIGTAYAANIISSRTFSSVDDLIRVSGIGEITLQKIKDQGLACVSSGTVQEEENNTVIIQSENSENKTVIEEETETPEESKPNSSVVNKMTVNADVILDEVKPNNSGEENKIIILSSKDIKSQENSQNSDKNRYMLYALMSFGTLILFLITLKYKKYKKNELQ